MLVRQDAVRLVAAGRHPADAEDVEATATMVVLDPEAAVPRLKRHAG
jgi:hypothetical protein